MLCASSTISAFTHAATGKEIESSAGLLPSDVVVVDGCNWERIESFPFAVHFQPCFRSGLQLGKN